jgi:hypothetical protein
LKIFRPNMWSAWGNPAIYFTWSIYASYYLSPIQRCPNRTYKAYVPLWYIFLDLQIYHHRCLMTLPSVKICHSCKQLLLCRHL